MSLRFDTWWIYTPLANDRPRPVSRKMEWEGVENFSVWASTYFDEASLKVFSPQTTNFSSEAGAVLNFFASFFGSSQKMKWGFRGKAPVIKF